MNLKWCAFTGALMLASVFATFYHKEVNQDPPGVSTRWWDGTVQSRETRFSSDKLQSRTEYGDDGITVVRYQEWNWEGKLVHSKVRDKKTGQVEEKRFSDDGAVLVVHKLWNGDERTFLVEREFHPRTGKLLSETINTADGLTAAEQRRFDDNGTLFMERRVLDNADQETKMFSGGKLRQRSVFKANGDQWVETFNDAGVMTSRSKEIRLDGDSVYERFSARTGKLVARRENNMNDRKQMATVSVFHDGEKVRLRQTFARGTLIKIEEFSIETGLPTRTVVVVNNVAVEAQLFGKDGRLERVKKLNSDGSVTKTIDYDADGKTVDSEKEGGEPEVVDPKLFEEALFMIEEGE